MIHQECKCFCCNRIIEIEEYENPMTIFPAYNALIFRATGNFGSTVFDPMPTRKEEMLQIVICDNCIKAKIKRVTRIYNIKRDVTAESEEFRLD